MTGADSLTATNKNPERPGNLRALLAYSSLVFITSALVLVVELVAARLIAPFVGASLYSWTAIIGVILAGLSVGNWAGGVWADHGASKSAAGWALLLSGLSIFAILLILPLLAGPLQSANLSLAETSLALAGVLFFLPAALLGIITPLLTTLALYNSQRPGHVVGAMHALAALGSILGTFTTGFWLIQWLGSRDIILATGTILVLIAITLLATSVAKVATAIASGLILAWALLAGYSDPCDHESNYFCMRVVDSSGDAPFGEAKSLVLDHLVHGTNHRQAPELIMAPYLHLMDELATAHTANIERPSYFFAGGGAFTLPRATRSRNGQARIVVAELDPEVSRVANQHLFVDIDSLDIHHADARAALHAQPDCTFDVVVGDVFHDIAVPHHLLTRQFATLVAGKLRPDGIYVMNVVDAFPDARLVKAIYKTLGSVFDQVDIWIDQLPTAPTRVTYVVSARHSGPILPDRHQSISGIRRNWYRVTEPVLAAGTEIAEIPLLSDDFAPIERLMAQLFLGETGR